MSAYESIAQGLNEALAFARGEEMGAVVYQVEVPAVDVSAIGRALACPKARSRAASASPRGRC